MGTIDGLLADRWMTREQIAQECGVSKQKISALVGEHHLPARVQVRDGRVKLYHLATLQKLLEVTKDVVSV